MPVVRVKGVANPMQFPDDMDINDIREFLRRRFISQMGESQPDLAPIESVAQEVKPSLAERAGQGISNVLYDSGIISDRYGAQRIGSNLSSIGEFLPVIGDATAGDEFGRAAAQGDKTGMLLAGLGAIPIAGDLAKKVGKSFNPLDEFTSLVDKTAARRGARLKIYNLPTKGAAESINDIADLFDYTPEQLVSQMKTLDQTGIRKGGYLKKGDNINIFYSDDGTSQMINPKTNEVIFDNDIEQTTRLIKDDILTTANGKLTQEQKAAAYQARKANDEAARAREAAQKDTYKMQHTAPMRGDNPSGDDLSPVYGEDIYSPNALRYYGTNSSYDGKAINIIKAMKGNPDKEITIYRAVPKSITEINSSDWITTTKEYAQDHMKGEKGWHVISKKVKAKDIASDGNSIHEFGYDPTRMDWTPEQRRATPPWQTLDVPEGELIYRRSSTNKAMSVGDAAKKSL